MFGKQISSKTCFPYEKLCLKILEVIFITLLLNYFSEIIDLAHI